MTAPSRLVISEILGGQQTYEKPFFINNDSFPTLQNAICWRKSIRKKQGSSFLGQLQRQIGTTGASPFTATISPVPIAHGTSQFLIGTVVLVDGDITGGAIATLTSSNGSYSGTLNRTTGALSITIPAIAPTAVYYQPGLPVMGIEQFESDKSANTQIDFPINVFFDQTYSYQFNGTNFYDVSFYKGTNNPVYWTGQNFQQFDSTNYFRAMFVTNNKPGMQFEPITNITVGATTSITTSTNPDGLVTGDYVFFNEITGADANLLNGQSAQITVTGANTFTVPINTVGKVINSNGIFQLMTAISPSGTGDGIRWYDGDPSGVSGLGWVNFAPPLDNLQSTSTTYLMGARIIVPFGNRLLAIGTYEDTSANASSPRYFGNRIRFCEVTATPFYSNPIPSTLPPGTFNANAWMSNIQGFGGFIDLDTTERIISAAVTQGSLILGLETEQRRLNNTGIETDPFTVQVINPEYGTAGTHAIIPMDKGILGVGEYGLLMTSSYDSRRFDEKIIDQVFQIDQANNGYERICAARDFVNEVVYFTYYSDGANANNTFPDTTIVFNYREGSFGLWHETFTTYGTYKNSTTQAWQNYFTPWENWNINWEDLGADRFSKPFVAGGTPQGYVMLKWDEDSFNDPSIFIQGIVNNGDGTYTITSPNHNLDDGDFIGFWSGPPSNTSIMPVFNGSVDSVLSINQFVVSFPAGATPGSIVPGIWQISMIDLLDIWTKQFQFAWSMNKKTRIGSQKYFLDTTTLGEFTVNIYGSQSDVSLNNPNSASIISSNIVRTRPDNSLGLNDNASSQDQIWHRIPTSAIGDTVQLEFTFSKDQMLDVNISTSPWVLYSTILDLYPSRTLA
jgi:hypothetical protein